MKTDDLRDVLVVDDNDQLRHAMVEYLRRLDLEVDAAINGREALERLSRATYALMLLDYQMPEVDGLTVIEELRQRATRPIVLVMTGFSDISLLPIDGDVVQAILRKPFDVAELGTIIKSCVAMSRGHLDIVVTEAE